MPQVRELGLKVLLGGELAGLKEVHQHEQLTWAPVQDMQTK
jgi:hypothetical protein